MGMGMGLVCLLSCSSPSSVPGHVFNAMHPTPSTTTTAPTNHTTPHHTPASWAHPVSDADKRRARTLGSKERDILETTLMRLNREMTLLENFCIINYTGFVKILKKHDKVIDVYIWVDGWVGPWVYVSG
jgi:hypothetical protein